MSFFFEKAFWLPSSYASGQLKKSKKIVNLLKKSFQSCNFVFFCTEQQKCHVLTKFVRIFFQNFIKWLLFFFRFFHLARAHEFGSQSGFPLRNTLHNTLNPKNTCTHILSILSIFKKTAPMNWVLRLTDQSSRYQWKLHLLLLKEYFSFMRRTRYVRPA